MAPFSSNPPNSTQTGDGCVVENARPVYDAKRGHLMPASCSHGTDTPDHSAARNGEAGHQRRR